MAVRKSTIRDRVSQVIAQQNPADRPIVTLQAEVGPSPLPWAVLGPISLAVRELFTAHYFVTVTEEVVMFHESRRVGNRPGELAFAVPRPAAHTRVSDIRRGAMCSSFRYALPGKQPPTRFIVRRRWRAELDHVIAILTSTRTTSEQSV
jgi:hypothetical protein